jgi:hypothetical protein
MSGGLWLKIADSGGMITSLIDQEINFSYRRRRLMQEAETARLANMLRAGNLHETERTRVPSANWYHVLTRGFWRRAQLQCLEPETTAGTAAH